MLAVNDLRSILDQAEKAVGREDYASAERLLRDALTLQESNGAGKREEVAKTLNNLAIVSEMAGKVADAEAYYRKAYEIAQATLPAGDPFVKTSRDNLEEFCRDRGLPLSRPSTAPAPAPPPPPAPARTQSTPAAPTAGVAVPSPPPKTAGFVPAAQKAPAAPPPPPPTPPPQRQPASAQAAAATATRQVTRPTPPPAAPPIAPRQPMYQPPQSLVASSVPARAPRSSRASLFVVLGLASFVAVIAGGRYLFRADGTPPQSSSAPVSPATPAPAPAPAPVVESSAPAAAPVPIEPPVATEPPPPEPTTPPPSTPVAAAPEAPTVSGKPAPPARAAAASAVNVVTADLCRNLSTTGAWKCTPATGPQPAGTLTFYTRVAAPRDTTIEHRWYRGDVLQQRVPLRIRPNPSGFRTYSRTRISADRGGDWRVELRTQDGQVLDTKTFVVN